jgi:hypothetical protein
MASVNLANSQIAFSPSPSRKKAKELSTAAALAPNHGAAAVLAIPPVFGDRGVMGRARVDLDVSVPPEGSP